MTNCRFAEIVQLLPSASGPARSRGVRDGRQLHQQRRAAPAALASDPSSQVAGGSPRAGLANFGLWSLALRLLAYGRWTSFETDTRAVTRRRLVRVALAPQVSSLWPSCTDRWQRPIGPLAWWRAALTVLKFLNPPWAAAAGTDSETEYGSGSRDPQAASDSLSLPVTVVSLRVKKTLNGLVWSIFKFKAL